MRMLAHTPGFALARMRKGPDQECRLRLNRELAHVWQSRYLCTTKTQWPYLTTLALCRGIIISIISIIINRDRRLVLLAEPVVALAADDRVSGTLFRARQLAHVWRYAVQHDDIAVSNHDTRAL
jgi:hypothetical protein